MLTAEPSSVRRRSPAVVWAVVALAMLAHACGSSQRTKALKLGHTLDTTHPVHKAMVVMADRVHEKSGGRMRIDIYPSQQLGTERECIELLQIGSLAMTKVSAAVMEGFAPSYRVLSLPYLFRNEPHRFQVMEGPIGRKLLQASEPKRLRGLCFYDSGSRSFYTTKAPVRTPADLAGLKIRTMEAATAINMVKALGGSATPLAFGELYTALQQGVVDGAENNPPSFLTSRHYEVARYYSLDEHSAIPDVMLVSTSVWSRLTPEEQGWLQEAADESAAFQKDAWRVASEEAMRKVEAAGVTILRPDKKPFMDKVQGMLAEYAKDPAIGELIREIQALP